MRIAIAITITIALLAAVLACSSAACSTCSGSRSEKSSVDAQAVESPSSLSPEVRVKLEAALRAKGPAYVPNTRHKNPDGSPTYTNRLILETSPYLLQHAHNPVSWFSWGDEAFETARRLGRPVFLSVGYSTCHWCHVMEEESFEDEEIARYLNENYVAIKVDREERPDVDAIYMSAVQSLIGSGGWPMNVWLTPERKPFYGGTYFPARDGERGTRVGFLTVLKKLRSAYDEDPSKVASSSAQIADEIKKRMAPEPGEGLPSAAVLDSAASSYRAQFDAVRGGLQRAPKFPSSLPIRFLLRHHRRSKSPESLRMATLTLEKMEQGGICDQVGGGFHRYSTDADWLVPHFEKMLYDNALLAAAYLEGYQATQREDFATTAREILRYVERDMTSPDGAFYSATDADSRGPNGHLEEGRFFTWTPAELQTALGVESARIVATHYSVTAKGDLDGRSILHISRPLAESAREVGLSEELFRQGINAARETLYAVRAKRPAPRRDEKILTAWNGLMISAHAKAALTLGDKTYADRGERAATFVLTKLRIGDRLMRSYKDGHARHTGYLDDYAFLIAGLLDLYEATSVQRWLDEAIRLDATLEAHFEDKRAGGFFTTSDDAEKLLAREKPSYDGAEPSGNSVHVLNLLRLAELTTKESYRKRAERTLEAFGGVLARSPTSLSSMLLGVDFFRDVPKEIVIVTRSPGRAEAEPFLATLRGALLPSRVLVVVSEGAELAVLSRVVPFVEAKSARTANVTAYVCEKSACKLPTSDPNVFADQLGIARHAKAAATPPQPHP